jgi:hypothetical protein
MVRKGALLTQDKEAKFCAWENRKDALRASQKLSRQPPSHAWDVKAQICFKGFPPQNLFREEVWCPVCSKPRMSLVIPFLVFIQQGTEEAIAAMVQALTGDLGFSGMQNTTIMGSWWLLPTFQRKVWEVRQCAEGQSEPPAKAAPDRAMCESIRVKPKL